MQGPSQVQPGSTVTYTVRVQNGRDGKRRRASSVWDIVLQLGQTTKRIHELRRGRSRTFTFAERVPLTIGRRFCTGVVAGAPDTRSVQDRLCLPVRRVAPAFTG